MKGANSTWMIVTGYVIVGSFVMLASIPVSGLLKRWGPRAARYANAAIITFGACVVALGEFGVAMFTAAVIRQL